MKTIEELHKSYIRQILRALNSSSHEVDASAAITTDGLIIASALNGNVDSDRFGAMCASLLALADRAAQEIERGALRQVLIEGENGTMLLVRAGPDTALALSARPTANLGMVFIEARKTAQKLCVEISRYSRVNQLRTTPDDIDVRESAAKNVAS
jgi:predicted regulator of Ras-like GTPase activity (Roadblock/LC7/MglB family)